MICPDHPDLERSLRIQRVVVDNFCSIRHADIEPSFFSVFVGQNNHGKTNLFEAIAWFYSGKGSIDSLRFGRQGNDEVSVEITLAEVRGGLARMRNARNRTSIENLIGQADTLRVRRSSRDGGKIRSIFLEKTGEWLERNPAGFDTAFNDFLPVFEYVDTKTTLGDVSKYGKATPIASMLSGVLAAILEQSEKYQQFKANFAELFEAEDSEVRVELDKVSGQVQVYVCKQFADCSRVKFEVTPPVFEDLLKSFQTSVDDGIMTEASEKGDGMQRAIMLAILETYADFRRQNEAAGKTFFFFIDEAELHLHPTAQRSLKRALQDLAGRGDQVFINTHSSVLVADDAEGQSIFKVEKAGRETEVQRIVPEERPSIIYELLGGSPSDLLLPRNFLIVEGKSEFEFLNRVIRRFYPETPAIQLIYAEGNEDRQRRSMDAINRAFVPLYGTSIYKDRLIILCDTPSEAARRDFEEFRRAYRALDANGQLHINPMCSLEEYYPEPWKKTPEEVAQLRQHRGIKVQLAQTVGQAIEREQFEREMPIFIDCCIKNAIMVSEERHLCPG
jgi:putative ATP-dependent endonuclease of the OLD family